MVRVAKEDEGEMFGRKWRENFVRNNKLSWKEVRKVIVGRKESVRGVNGNLLKGSDDI